MPEPGRKEEHAGKGKRIYRRRDGPYRTKDYEHRLDSLRDDGYAQRSKSPCRPEQRSPLEYPQRPKNVYRPGFAHHGEHPYLSNQPPGPAYPHRSFPRHSRSDRQYRANYPQHTPWPHPCERPKEEIIERSFGVTRRVGYFKEYTSYAKICGLPLVHSVSHPWEPNKRSWRWAAGIIAVGPFSIGIFAIGWFAFGLFTLAGISVGILASAGIIAVGGVAALGNVAATIGFAIGNIAIGYYALGQVVGQWRHSRL